MGINLIGRERRGSDYLKRRKEKEGEKEEEGGITTRVQNFKAEKLDWKENS